jgi:hypothetical protein
MQKMHGNSRHTIYNSVDANSASSELGPKGIRTHYLNLLLHFFPLVFRFVTLADYSSLEFWNGQRRSGGKLGTTLKIVDGRGETVGWFIEARTQTLLLRGWC